MMTCCLLLIVLFISFGVSIAFRLGNVRNRFFRPLYSTFSTLDSDLPSHSLSAFYAKVLSTNMVEMKGAPTALLQKLRDLQEEINSWKVESTTDDPSTSLIDLDQWRTLTSHDSPRPGTIFSTSDVAFNYLLWRISTTVQYNQTEIDLFLPWKGKRLTEGLLYIEDICGQLPDVLDLPLQSAFPLIAVAALYGSDPNVLSFIEKSSDRNSRSEGKRIRKFDLFSQTISSLERSIVCNDMIKITDFSSRFLSEEATFEPSSRLIDEVGFNVNIIPACAGRGLIGDLVLAELLLAYGSDKVTFHCGQIPTLDGIPTRKDVIVHIQHLANPSNSDIWALRHLGESLNRHLFAGRIVIEEHDMMLTIPDVIVNPLENSLNIVRNKKLGQALQQRKMTTKEGSLTALMYTLTPEEMTTKQTSRYRVDASLDYEPMPGVMMCCE